MVKKPDNQQQVTQGKYPKKSFHSGPYIKTSVAIQQEIWNDFKKLSNNLDYKIQHAVSEALSDWIEKNS